VSRLSGFWKTGEFIGGGVKIAFLVTDRVGPMPGGGHSIMFSRQSQDQRWEPVALSRPVSRFSGYRNRNRQQFAQRRGATVIGTSKSR